MRAYKVGGRGRAWANPHRIYGAVMFGLTLVWLVQLSGGGGGMADAFHSPGRLAYYDHKPRRRSFMQQPLPTKYMANVLVSATESDSPSDLDDVLEKFAMPLEFKKGGDASAEKDSSGGSGSNAVASSGDESGAAKSESPSPASEAASFTPSADTPLANKYYLKNKQLAEESKKMESQSAEQRTEETTDAPPPPTPPPRRRFADFGIASEQAEPIGGAANVQESSPTDDTTAPSKFRGFTDWTAKPSRPFKVNMEQNEKTASVGVSETKPLSSDNAKPQDTAAKVQTKAPETTKSSAPTVREEKLEPKVTPGTPEEKSPAPAATKSATKEESTATPSPAATTSAQPPSTELVQTQPSSPTNTLTLPSLNLDVEDFGLLPLVIIGVSVSLALGVYLKQANESDARYTQANMGGKNEEEQGLMGKTKELLQKVKDAGTAGAISYALWEAAFWGVSIPVCLVSYRQVTGHWPDLTNGEDVRKVGLEAFAFVNFARLAVPIRIGLALSTVPWVEENVLPRLPGSRTNGPVDENVLTSQEVMIDSPENDGLYGDVYQQSQIDTSPYYNDQEDEVEGEDAYAVSEVEERLSKIESEASQITRTALDSINEGIDSSLLEYCEPGQVNDDCSESIQTYLDSLASTGAVATDGEVKAIVGYLDSLGSNSVVAPNEKTGAAFTTYLDALSNGYVPAPPSAKAVASYLDVLSDDSSLMQEQSKELKIGTRINEVEDRLIRLEADIASLPDDIASRLVDWQDKKMSDELEKIMKLLVRDSTNK